METIYPDDNEIKFRYENYKDIEVLLNEKIECTICNNDLLNEIISKKMIMVHRTHLFLCCYNCFYKLCEGHEYSCISCKSNNELCNCEKCNLNVCKRCVKNHKINQVSGGVINKCFNCEPHTLWKQRAQAANVLQVFSSQLDLPNGLLVNEVECEQTVRKYLVNEAKIGQNSSTDKVRDRLCLNFILNTYKCTLSEKLDNFFPKSDSIPFEKCLRDFSENCEYILEKTCSTLTNFKRIFKLSSNLNPGVIAMIKTFLKSVDEDDSKFTISRYNIENTSTTLKNNEINEKSSTCEEKTKSNTKKYMTDGILNSTIPTINNDINYSIETIINKEPTVLLERLDQSILMKNMKKNITKNPLSDVEKDETVHPLDLFNDLSSISSDTEYSRTLRNRKVLTKKLEKKKKKSILVEKSDDEKENDRLTNFNSINQRYIKKNGTDANLIDGKNISNIVSKKGSNILENKMEAMQQVIKYIDDTDSDDDNDSENDDYSQKSIKDIFNDIPNSMSVPLINSNSDENESDDSSISDVVNLCLIACKKHGIDHYRKRNQENGNDVGDELENEENMEISEFSDKNNETVTVNHSRNISPFRMPSDDSDAELKLPKKINSNKRKLVTSDSSNGSDSSSKYFKKTPKKLNKSKNSFFNLTVNSNSSNNSDSDYSPYSSYSPIITKKRKRIKKLSTDNSNEESDEEYGSSNNPSLKKGRRNIRKMKDEEELSEMTKDALKEEESRKMRVERRQKIYNQIYDLPTPIESFKKLVLDFDSETKKELITVHPDLVKYLKPHQINGVKFLWDSVFESLNFIKEKKKGSGSILAHCMGLGKTLQVITLVHTLFRHHETGIKTVLIITPHSTIDNWCKEFQKWLNDVQEEVHFLVHNFSDAKTYENRKIMIEAWQSERGVLVTSYQSYRTVVQFKGIDKYPTILEALVDPGPDLIICDEGHLLKNHNSAISKAVNRIKTLRRIVLTGTPLQNNLKEYHCMVDFIRPNLLGSLKDFTNRFINPITNGQYSDSTPMDVKLMKRRSHVLHRMLEGFVQRCDYTVLTPFLPPKHEYVIYLKMSSKQIELYQNYLNKYRQQNLLFANYHMLQMIWTHPKLLSLYSKQIEKKKQKLKDMESTSTDTNSDSESHSSSIEEIENVDHNWWKEFVTKKDLETVHPYSKFIMMFSLLQECEEIGDKVLIFSQSLNTLDIIQEFLEYAEFIQNDMGGPYGKSWNPGEDFFRIDGSVNLKDREECCDQFNDVTNTRMRLLLLSTKAFNLGVNLVAANRVIIFDVTWNPTLNVQSIFRVFRFGQTKPCYIYRFISEGTMEQKMYERQISKLSMAFRVVDEHQIDRHFNAKNQEELYEFEPKTSASKTINLPKDRLLAELILKHKDLVIDVLEHDSLLQNNEAEELDENDRNAAWDDYEKERAGLNREQQFIQNTDQNISFNKNLQNMLLSRMQTSPDDLVLFNTLKNVFPKASILQLNDMLIQVRKSQNIQAAEQ